MQTVTPKDCLALTTLPPVILLACADRVRTNRLCDRLREIHKSDTIERIHLASSTSSSFAALIDSLSTLSLFAQVRLVLIDIPEKKHPLTEQLLTSLAHVSLGTTVVLRFSATFPPAPTLRALPKETIAVEMEKLAGEKLCAWLAREASRLGVPSINTGALQLIAQYSATQHNSEDLDNAYQALEQIALYADGSPITEHTVRSVITVIPEAEEFALLDLIDNGALPRTEHLSERLLSQGSNAFVLLAMIARNQMNRIAVRAGVAARTPDDVLRRSLNMTPWIFDRTKKLVSRANLPSMKQAIGAIVRADTRLKGKSLGPDSILSELFNSLMPSPSRPRDNAAPGCPAVDSPGDRI